MFYANNLVVICHSYSYSFPVTVWLLTFFKTSYLCSPEEGNSYMLKQLEGEELTIEFSWDFVLYL